MAIKHVTSVCQRCGAIFEWRQHNPGIRQFCSISCRNSARARSWETQIAEHLEQFSDPDVCWSWTGALNNRGYGVIVACLDYRRHRMLTHRAAYIVRHGAILNGLCVLHRCDNPPCCNPAHLFLGTQADNIHDMIAKGREGFRGERQRHAKLTDEIVRNIRASTETQSMMSRRLGVSRRTIGDVLAGMTWKHVV